MSLQIAHKFPLRRYGRYIEPIEDEATRDPKAATMDRGNWNVRVSTDESTLFIYVTDTDMMLVHQGVTTYECIFLLNSKDWVRGVARGDSILLASRFHEGNERRFRVQFDRFADKTGVEQCQACVNVLSKYFPFHDQPEPPQGTQPRLDIPGFFNQQFESPETLHQLVKSCLQDPSFPGFVQQVEDVMNEALDKPS
ncbi:unnamed protein product [Ixodes hexagonus]